MSSSVQVYCLRKKEDIAYTNRVRYKRRFGRFGDQTSHVVDTATPCSDITSEIVALFLPKHLVVDLLLQQLMESLVSRRSKCITSENAQQPISRSRRAGALIFRLGLQVHMNHHDGLSPE